MRGRVILGSRVRGRVRGRGIRLVEVMVDELAQPPFNAMLLEVATDGANARPVAG